MNIRYFLIVLIFHNFLLTYAKPVAPEDFGHIIPIMLEKMAKEGARSSFLEGIANKFGLLEQQENNNLSWAKLKQREFSQTELDFIAYQFCQITQHSFIVIIWPRAHRHTSFITQELAKCGAVMYERQVTFKRAAQSHLLKTIPEKSREVSRYLYYYFNNQPETRFTVLLCTLQDLATARACKKRIRQKLNLEPHPVVALHISDNQSQSIDLAQNFFNQTSIKYLNSGIAPNKFEKFNFMLTKDKTIVKEHVLNPEYCCVDGSSILAIHGIRDINVDFDFLSSKPNLSLPRIKYPYKNYQLGPLDVHNNAWVRAGVDPIETIFNPNHHFYFQGVKYTSLERIREFKYHQNREVDRRDVVAIDKVIAKTRNCDE